MKTVLFSIGLCLCVGFSAMAQDVDEDFSAAYANKRGVYLLPQAGDFALGVDATPLLRYAGNFFSTYNSAPVFDQTMIYGKYFLEDNRAIRARLMLDLSNVVNKRFIVDDVKVTNDPEAAVIDAQHLSTASVLLAAGYEFRRGNGRVQGYYGGEVLLGYGGGKAKYEYGNRMNDDFKSPSYYSFYENYVGPSARVTEVKYGKTITAGLGAFAGVEYFFAPQMSIGCEFNLGFLFSSTSQYQRTVEKWDFTDDVKKVQTEKGKIGDAWYDARKLEGFTQPTGSIFLMFHF